MQLVKRHVSGAVEIFYTIIYPVSLEANCPLVCKVGPGHHGLFLTLTLVRNIINVVRVE